MREQIINLLMKVAQDYLSRGFSYELHQGHDIHAYLHLWTLNPEYPTPSKTVHIQGYPGLSNEKQARVYARLMDFEKMRMLRERGGISIGNEHEAVIQSFPDFQAGIFIPYNSAILEELLEKNVPELKPGQGGENDTSTR